jgi:DNA-binding transcriptional LysR family regulator
MESLDVRCLEVFCEVYKTRSVSRSAENLKLSQSAVSISLGRLRDHFNDPLFVRTTAGMRPTSLGSELLGPVSEALDAVERAIGHRPDFNPLTSFRKFRICMSDISHIVVLPPLWSYLRTVSPSIQIEILPLSEGTAALLESGDADMALGFMPQLEKSFHEQTLFRQSYVCATSAVHARVRDGLTQAQFEAENHAEVTRSGTGHLILEKELARLGVERRVVLQVPSFLSLEYVLEDSNLLVMLPKYLGSLFESRGRIRTFALPFELHEYAVKLHWHERFHRDPGAVWMRKTLRDLCLHTIKDLNK